MQNEENVRYSLCQADFWITMCSSISEAGGSIVYNKLRTMNLVGFANHYAQNGIRLVFDKNKTISNIK